MNPEYIDSRACEMIQRIRNAMGWSYEALGAILHASETTAFNICNGTGNAHSEKLNRLFMALARHRDQAARTYALELLGLVTGDVSIAHHFLDEVTLQDMSLADSYDALATAERQSLEAFEAVLELMKGGVDPTDRGEQERLWKAEHEGLEAINARYNLIANLKHEYERRSRRSKR